MVSLKDVQESNSRIATDLPAGLVAVFVGATSGIGEYTLKAFSRHALRPRIYFVGRSQKSGDRIRKECLALNPDGEYIFLQGDMSLIKNVDDACLEIKKRETAINLLVMTMGTLETGSITSEGLHYPAALLLYGRNRFASNLLPLLQKATTLRRVVSVLAAGKEGPVFTDNLQFLNVSLWKGLGHGSSMITLSLEGLSERAPNVTFIHDHPGLVKTNIVRGKEGMLISAFSAVTKILQPLLKHIPEEECGDRHVFLATSARYANPLVEKSAAGVPLPPGNEVARGTNGEIGSGVYSIDPQCESTGPKVEAVVAKLRSEGVVEKIWAETEAECKRITGKEFV